MYIPIRHKYTEWLISFFAQYEPHNTIAFNVFFCFVFLQICYGEKKKKKLVSVLCSPVKNLVD